MNLDPILKRLNLTQRELAQEIGVREEAVSRWVNEHHTPDGRNLLSILTALQKRDPAITFQQLIGVEALPLAPTEPALPAAAND